MDVSHDIEYIGSIIDRQITEIEGMAEKVASEEWSDGEVMINLEYLRRLDEWAHKQRIEPPYIAGPYTVV